MICSQKSFLRISFRISYGRASRSDGGPGGMLALVAKGVVPSMASSEWVAPISAISVVRLLSQS
jgi:hypothetical protein